MTPEWSAAKIPREAFSFPGSATVYILSGRAGTDLGLMACPDDTDGDDRLVRACLAGDVNAFEHLFERHYHPLMRRLRTRFAATDAEDLAQEAFLRAWRGLSQLREPDRFRPWLASIVASLLAEAHRCRVPLATEGSTLERIAGAADDAQSILDDRFLVRYAMTRLPPPQRTALALFYFAGLRPLEIAHRLGIPESTVHGRLQTGRRSLHKELTAGRPAQPLSRERPWPVVAALRALRHQGFAQEFDARGRVVALYLGIPAALEARPSPDHMLRVRGTAWGLGDVPLAALQISYESTPDTWRSGPAAGEVLAETVLPGSAARPRAVWRPTNLMWTEIARRVEQDGATGDPVSAACVAQLSRPGIRLSLVEPVGTERWVEEPGISERDALCQAFAPNLADAGGWHGAAARLTLRLEVPAGATLALIALADPVGPVTLRELRADICLVGAEGLTASAHTGTLLAMESTIADVQGVQGALLARQSTYGSGVWDDTSVQRSPTPTTRIADVTGEIDVRFARADLTLEGLRGTAQIQNRFGPTLLRWAGNADLVADVRTVTGDVRLESRTAAIPEVSATTAAGRLQHTPGLHARWRLTRRNDGHTLALYNSAHPRIRLHSDAGCAALTLIPTDESLE